MHTLRLIFRFAAFTLVEYVRSGRALVEAAATIAVYAIFFRRQALDGDHFFALAALFTLALTFYTSSTILGLGDRPQGYLILARRIGRTGYLLGLYLAIILVTAAAYGALSLLVAAFTPVAGLGVAGWLLGSLPLLLNMFLLAALLTLIAPFVLSSGWRLALLGLIALAFSNSLLGGSALATLPTTLLTTIEVLRTMASAPLLPAFSGYELAISRDYSGPAFVIPLAQLSLTLGILALAVYAFARRDLIFSSN
ncbi:MAG TPA: hypothetical protein PKA05_14655 [Roseiflexaceae bacterium]|nr:hypothetical protein [Roseiflexaceae bacterium]HMP41617.1 hypothetical protein [Roseiflexaceae bacterium]